MAWEKRYSLELEFDSRGDMEDWEDFFDLIAEATDENNPDRRMAQVAIALWLHQSGIIDVANIDEIGGEDLGLSEEDIEQIREELKDEFNVEHNDD